MAPWLPAKGPCKTTADLRVPASNDGQVDRVDRVDRRVQGRAILTSWGSTSTGSFTAFLASRASCDGTLVSGHGNSGTGSKSPPTIRRSAGSSVWSLELKAAARLRC